MKRFDSLLVRLAPVIALLAALGAPAAAQSEFARVTGTVVDSEGNPVVGIELFFDGGEAYPDFTVKTKKKGRFSKGNVNRGAYTPTLADTNYRITEISVVVRGGGQKLLDQTETLPPGTMPPPIRLQPTAWAKIELVIAENQRGASIDIAAAKENSGAIAELNEYFERSDWEGLISASDKALAENDGVGAVHYLRGIAFWQNGQLAEAVGALERSVELAPDQEGIKGTIGTVLVQHGQALSDGGDADGAREAFSAAVPMLDAQLAASPGAKTYLVNLIVALEGTEEVDRLLVAVDQLIAIDPDDPRPYLRKAEIMTNAGRPEEAIAAVTQMPAAGEGALAQIYNAATELWNSGNVDATLAAVDKIISIDPDYALAYKLKGRALVSKGDTPAAIAALETYLGKVPADDPEAEIERNLIKALKGAGG